MKYVRDSLEYQINRCALEEMEELVPMTRSERYKLRKWVISGHELEANPWDYLDSDGYPLNYLQALRLHDGYSYGPWDNWKGPEYCMYWNDMENRLMRHNEI